MTKKRKRTSREKKELRLEREFASLTPKIIKISEHDPVQHCKQELNAFLPIVDLQDIITDYAAIVDAEAFEKAYYTAYVSVQPPIGSPRRQLFDDIFQKASPSLKTFLQDKVDRDSYYFAASFQEEVCNRSRCYPSHLCACGPSSKLNIVALKQFALQDQRKRAHEKRKRRKRLL